MPCGHLLGKGWPLGSCLWCLTVSLFLSHWYPGSSVVLDCINSWSLHPYLLWYGALKVPLLDDDSTTQCTCSLKAYLVSLLCVWEQRKLHCSGLSETLLLAYAIGRILGYMVASRLILKWSWKTEIESHHVWIQKVCQRGPNYENIVFVCCFFGWWGKEGSRHHYKRAIIGLPANLLACRCSPNIECWLGTMFVALWFFRGSGPVLLRNPIYL